VGGVVAAGAIVAIVVTVALPKAKQELGEAVLGGRVQEAAILHVLISENAHHYAFACLGEGALSPDRIISALQLTPTHWATKAHSNDTPATIFYAPDTGPTDTQVLTFERRMIEGTVCLLPKVDIRTRARS
jgi:hypothetical protein